MDEFPDDFNDIDQWRKEYRPQQNAFKPGADSLEDGPYDMQVTYAELAKVGTPAETIFRLGLKVLSGPRAGLEIEKPTFFRQQRNADELGGDLLTMGFAWDGSGAQLKATCPQIVGLRLACKKRSWDKKEKGLVVGKSHGLDILSVLRGSPMPAGGPPFNEFASQPAMANAGACSENPPW